MSRSYSLIECVSLFANSMTLYELISEQMAHFQFKKIELIFKKPPHTLDMLKQFAVEKHIIVITQLLFFSLC